MCYNKGWLNYHRIEHYPDVDLLSKLYLCGVKDYLPGDITFTAVKELVNAINGMLNIDVEVDIQGQRELIPSDKYGIIIERCNPEKEEEFAEYKLVGDGFLLKQCGFHLLILARTESGIMYGVFELIRRIASNQSINQVEILENPKNPLRMLNHWDNMDGSIERGYSGNSFFFEDKEVVVNDRTKDYARLIASVGINGVVINNVNVRAEATELITDRYLGKLKEMADIFANYGIRLFVSANFAAPMEIGGLSLADPLDEGVANWWKDCIRKVYEAIPGFGGFLIKADSEGRPGPFTYNRTHADGANVLARALKPYGGLVVWRCFVYNCQQDWRDYKTDRARAAYDNFIGLDGKFDENVILQIKNGPMDFQVREPVSPLFGGLKNTNQMLEVQIAQEYTGQQRHVCYLIPMWKEVLDFNTYAKPEGAKIADIVSGRTYGQVNCGMAAVANTGNNYNWTGHDLAAANLYGYGRLAWNTDMSSEAIAKEWICMTYSYKDKVVNNLLQILLKSWPAYEKYTSPLGIGWMVNPNNHYGPNVDGYEYDRWGTYHRADRNGLGVDRTKEGTGYAQQYNEPNASMYENIETCPEELLLFFHYVRYDYKLKSGKTLIQHIYDTHFEGVSDVEDMIRSFEEIKSMIPEDVYQRVMERFAMQLDSAKEWRDRINTYFYRKSGVEDAYGRKIYK